MGLLDAPPSTRAMASRKTSVTAPTGWTGTNPLAGKLYVDQYGLFSTTVDPTTRKYVGGVTYYVDSVAGSDSNSGLTDPLALATITAAIAKSDVGTIMVKGNGVANPYYRGRGFNSAVFSKSLNIIGYGSGLPYITTHDLLTYTLTAGQTFTYQTTRSSVSDVLDMANGLVAGSGIRLTNVASIAAVEALAGSWFQSGTTLYVHASDSRNLSTTQPSRIWALLDVPNVKTGTTADYTIYLENLQPYGGTNCVLIGGLTAAGAVVTLNNVGTGLSTLTGLGNVSLIGCDSLLIDCDTDRSGLDGYNYHAGGGKTPSAIEINCRSSDIGHTITDQCSSMHDGGQIIRVNGEYRRSMAANFTDVGGALSWNLGCIGDKPGVGFSNFQSGISGDATGTKMWLHGCSASNGDWATSIFGTGSLIKQRGSRLNRNQSPVTTY